VCIMPEPLSAVNILRSLVPCSSLIILWVNWGWTTAGSGSIKLWQIKQLPTRVFSLRISPLGVLGVYQDGSREGGCGSGPDCNQEKSKQHKTDRHGEKSPPFAISFFRLYSVASHNTCLPAKNYMNADTFWPGHRGVMIMFF